MREELERTALILGEEKVESLKDKAVIVFGVGGVGGYVVEALVRSGIGRIGIVDADTVSASNINRQIIANIQTVGRKKVDIMEKRMLSINPEVKVDVYSMFYLPGNADEIDLTQYDYVIDAIDTVTAKIELVMRCDAADIPIISSMGTGNRLDPTKLAVTDLYKTEGCPLAKVMRRELKKRGIRKLKCVYSTEKPIKLSEGQTPGSSAFVPPAAGLIIASFVVRQLLN